MKFFLSAAAFAASLLISTTNGYHPIVPESVSLTTRKSWCDSQVTQCPYLCSQYDAGQEAQTNSCDPDRLTYICVCKNNIVPNASEFTLTLDYFVCQTWGQQCKESCNAVEACIVQCDKDVQCGAQNPRGANQSRPTTAATSTGSGSGSGSGPGPGSMSGPGSGSMSGSMSGSGAGTMGSSAPTTTGSAAATLYSGFTQASGTGSQNATATAAAARLQLRVDAFSVGQTFGVVGLAGAFVAGFALLL